MKIGQFEFIFYMIYWIIPYKTIGLAWNLCGNAASGDFNIDNIQ